MSDTTPRTALPLLAAAQAQKHVTHNEALIELDGVIGANILDRDLSTPPLSPADGDTYLVKATGTGAWAGQDGKLAYAIDGGWRFYTPFSGLVAHIEDEAIFIFYDGGAWAALLGGGPLQNVPLLGVNTTASDPNKLAVKSNAVLFSDIDAVDGGTGDIRAVVNKEAAADTASFLFQDAFSGRAEIGLTGDDNFHFKVSPDGTTFYEALILNRNTGSQLLKHVDVSGAVTLGATHLGRIVRADASAAAFAVTLPASADADDWVAVRKKDSSANRVTVKRGLNDVAWLSAQSDEAMFAFWDGSWTAVRWSLAPLRNVFTAGGTWSKPPLANNLEIFCFGGAGGGGSGRRDAAGTTRAGGGGGAPGGMAVLRIPASAASASETVTVGTAGSGGAPVTVDSTDGAVGGSGGASSFGSHVKGIGGAGGAGGTSANVSGGASSLAFTNFGQVSGGGDGHSNAGIDGGAGFAGAGGGAGGINSTDVDKGGGNGGAGSSTAATPSSGGSFGSGGGNPGGAGTSIANTSDYFGGGGGGGGGGNAAGAGGAGGDGGAPNGGGGGGGASVNGFASGAGGDGARGEVRVVSYF